MRELTELERTLVEAMKALNSCRFLYGSANRLNGIQLSRVEPCNVLLFTAGAQLPQGAFQRFTSNSYQLVPGNMYEEVFHWD